MRLSKVLSKGPSDNFYQVDGFLPKINPKKGIQTKINVGDVGLDFFCEECDDKKTFCSQKPSYCMGIDKTMVIVSSLLCCAQCKKNEVLVWFLLEGTGAFSGNTLSVRVKKRWIKLLGGVQYGIGKQDELSELLNKAETCYFDELGVGAVIYLRVILEKIVNQLADTLGSPSNGKTSGYVSFKSLLEMVDAKLSIIPAVLKKNSYKLFREMSEIVHGKSTDEKALNEYNALKSLVEGILKTVEVNEETSKAIKELGWKLNGDKDE